MPGKAAVVPVCFPAGTLVHVGVPGAYQPACGVTSSAQPKNPLERVHAKVTCQACEILAAVPEVARDQAAKGAPPAKRKPNDELRALLKELGV